MTNEMNEFIKKLKSMEACKAGIEFVMQFDTPQAAWEACNNGTFMEWYLDEVGRSSEIASAYSQYDAAIDEARRQYNAALDEAYRQYRSVKDEASRQYIAVRDEARRQYDVAEDEALSQYRAVEGEARRQYVRDIRKIIPIIPALT